MHVTLHGLYVVLSSHRECLHAIWMLTQIWQAAFPRWKAEMRKRLTAITWPLTSRPLSRSSGQLRTTCPRDPDQRPPQRPLRNCPSPVKSPLNWSGSTSLKNRKESTHVNHAYQPSLYHRCPLLFRSLCVLLDHLTKLILFRKTTLRALLFFLELLYCFLSQTDTFMLFAKY